MNVEQLCRETYQEFVRTAPGIDDELRRALRAHERIPRFLDNLAREFTIIEKMDPRFRGVNRITRDEIVDMTRQFCAVFCKNVKLQYDQRVMSDNAKAVIRDEQQRTKEMNQLADDLIEGSDEKTTKNAEGHETSTQSIDADPIV